MAVALVVVPPDNWLQADELVVSLFCNPLIILATTLFDGPVALLLTACLHPFSFAAVAHCSRWAYSSAAGSLRFALSALGVPLPIHFIRTANSLLGDVLLLTCSCACCIVLPQTDWLTDWLFVCSSSCSCFPVLLSAHFSPSVYFRLPFDRVFVSAMLHYSPFYPVTVTRCSLSVLFMSTGVNPPVRLDTWFGW